MYFGVLPDRPDAVKVAERLTDRPGYRVIRHASGRPWLVGQWPDEECSLIVAGPRRLVVFGRTDLPQDAVRRVLAGARTVAELDTAAMMLTGSCHLIASVDGWTRAQGSISTARQIFFTDVDGVTVAADGPRLLAELKGPADGSLLPPDPGTLALRLLTPNPPWPLSMRPVWPQIEALGVGCRLELGPKDSARTVRWWRPPDPELPATKAAEPLREALLAALTARARSPLSIDLSGGMDSTSLCFLANAVGAEVITHHWAPVDRGNDDTLWARRAAAHLPAARHRFVAIEDSPTWYETELTPHGRPAREEGPMPWTRSRAHMERLVASAAHDGAACHLIGVGGDELFGVLPTALWSQVRRHPVRGLASAQRFRMLNRWSLLSTARGLMDRTSFATWLAGAANRLSDPAPGPTDALLAWGWEPRMPPWATAEATEAVRSMMRTYARQERPQAHHPDRAQHQTLDVVVQSGGGVRQLDAALAAFEVGCEAPYLDDRVVEAALRVRIEDRLVSGEFKPVLRLAVDGIVPQEILARRSKGEFSAEAFRGIRHNRARLLELCDDLRLAELGLVDADALRTALLSPKPDFRHLVPYEATLACEGWLRSVRETDPFAGGTR
ncbi:asparagine synthase-related protein [Streptomyces sp. NPDC101152]|uniref:asparagine synthase-related protein n=1 Tax=Streptomyces sp. NPDC101152 TaxID=3366116 RepID=UPI0038289B9B